MVDRVEERDGLTEDERKLKTWRGRIELAREYQKRFGDQDGRWGKNVRALAGDFNSRQMLGEEAVDVNIIHAHVNTILPPLWLSEPRIRVRPTTDRYKDMNNVERARYAELEINYWVRELDLRQRVKEAVHDAETTNCGYVYVGYTTKSEDIKVDGEVIEARPDVKHRQPFLRRLSPRQVLMEPGKASIEDCEWISIEWTKRHCDVAKRYDIDPDDLKATGTLMDKESEPAKSNPVVGDYLESNDAQTVKVYQIWDKRHQKVITICDGYDGILDEGDWPFDGMEGFPIEKLSFNYLPDEQYATPEMSYYFPQQIELNAARTSIRKRNNRSKSVVWVSEDISTAVEDQYRNAEDGAVIRTGLPGGDDIRKHVLIDEGLPVDQHSLLYANISQEDFREISGLGRNQRGEAEGGTATESSIIEKWVNTRMSNRGDTVRTFYVNIVRKLYKIILQMPNQERSFLIAGQRHGVFSSVRYTTKEIEGEYSFEVDIEPVIDDNPMARQQRAYANYNLLAQDPLVNREKLILDILEAQGKNDPGGYLLSLKTPEAEFQSMLQGLPVETHERDDHMGHMSRHEVQAAQLEQLLDKVMGEGADMDNPEVTKIQMALALMLAHMNDHGRQIQAMVGSEAAGRLNQPADLNALRAQVNGGAETPAELQGQPLDRPGQAVQTPAGIPTE